jgi:capsular polysaccharide biosynthesis protein
MIEEPLDFKRAVQVVRRRKLVVCAAAVLGVVAGAGWAMLRPPMLTSEAGIALPPTTKGGVGTQVVFAGSQPVLADALHDMHSSMSPDALRHDLDIRSITPTLIVIKAHSRTAAQAELIANAVARSYVDYVRDPGNVPGGPVEAQVWAPATPASGTKALSHLVGMAVVGAVVGAVIAVLSVLAISRRDRRLRERDAIADSIGVPVVASIAVDQPSDAAGWRKLLAEYEPGSVDAWRMRKALQYLGVADPAFTGPRSAGFTLTVISGSFDRKALAIGPQLAAFAASRGIPTALVVGPQQDVAATATLRAACSVPPEQQPSRLRVAAIDHADDVPKLDAALIVFVAVVDGETPEIGQAIRTTATVLAVSAGAASAEQLARIAASAATGGHDIIGTLVADPDPADTTTGRLPHVDRPAHRRGPNRMTGTALGVGE